MAEDSNLRPSQKEQKIDEGLRKIKESYEDIKTQYAQDAAKLPQQDAAKITEGLENIKKTYNDIKKAYN